MQLCLAIIKKLLLLLMLIILLALTFKARVAMCVYMPMLCLYNVSFVVVLHVFEAIEALSSVSISIQEESLRVALILS